MTVGRRLGVVAIIVVTLFTGLFGRLAYLQLVQRATLERRIEAQLVTSAKIPNVRGQIYDRSGHPLVVNQKITLLTIEKGKLPKKQQVTVLTRLAELLGVPYINLVRRLDDPTQDSALPIPVARNVRESASVYIAEHAERFPGVSVEETSVRAYPNGNLAAHVLGYLGRIKDNAELAALPPTSSYDERDVIGRTGVEQSFETDLRGRPGQRTVRVDRLGRVVPGSERLLAKPIPGSDLYLTIDERIQSVASESLLAGLKVARTQNDERGRPFQAPAGAAVVLDLLDGSMVASTSYPTYNPQEFVGGISAAESARLLAPAAPLSNRVISGLYAPASTIKPFSSIAALADNLISPNTPFEDTGTFQLDIPGVQRVFRNAGSVAHGRITLTRAITVSSDTFFYWIGERFWQEAGHQHEAMQEVARNLGLGEKTEIRLPNEKSGRVPDKSTKAALHKRFPIAFPDPEWRTGDTMNVAVGQGETVVTPLQLAVAYGALALNGEVISPKIALDPASVAALKRPSPTTVAAPLSATPDAKPLIDGSPSTGGSPSTIAVPGQRATTVASSPTEPLASTSAVPSSTGATTVATVPVPATIAGVPAKPVIGGPAPGTPPRVRRRVSIDSAILDPVLAGMRGAVADPAGTAYDAFATFPLDRFPIFGKTGTAQTGKKSQDNAVFASFGPWPNPRYVVIVIMEKAGFGGKVAAPVARRIFEALFDLPLTPVRVAGQTRD